jgi:hypothetical protein
MFACLITELLILFNSKLSNKLVSNPSGIIQTQTKNTSQNTKQKLIVHTKHPTPTKERKKISDLNIGLRTKRNFILLYSLLTYFAEGNAK